MSTPIIEEFTLTMPPHKGLHDWLWDRVVYLKSRRAKQESLRAELKRKIPVLYDLGVLRREITDRDIDEAVNNCYRNLGKVCRDFVPVAYDPVDGWPKYIAVPDPSEWPENPEKIAAALKSAPRAAPKSQGSFFDLYQDEDILCLGQIDDMRPFKVSHLKANPALVENAEYVVSSPLRKPYGLNKHGGQAAHCRDTAGPRRYAVFESDSGRSVDDQVAVLLWFEKHTGTKLRMMVHTGGKSVHGWFDVRHMSPQEFFNWLKLACEYGADPRMFLPEQKCRAPGGWRAKDSKRQKVLYVNAN